MSRRALFWLLVLLDCTIVLVFLAVAANASGLDLPVLPPDDPRRADYVPGTRPSAPTAPGPKDSPRPPVFAGRELTGWDGDSVAYVVDKSSSMDGRRWEAAKRIVVQSVQSLPEGTRWSVLVYDSHVPPYYAFRPRLGDHEREGLSPWLEGHRPLASTATAPAVLTALQWAPDRVVLLTDGAPNVIGGRIYHPEHHRQLIRQGNPGARIDVFAVELADPVAVGFCHGVAGDSGGDVVRVVLD